MHEWNADGVCLLCAVDKTTPRRGELPPCPPNAHVCPFRTHGCKSRFDFPSGLTRHLGTCKVKQRMEQGGVGMSPPAFREQAVGPASASSQEVEGPPPTVVHDGDELDGPDGQVRARPWGVM